MQRYPKWHWDAHRGETLADAVVGPLLYERRAPFEKVAAPITTAPVNMSVMSMTVQHLDHCADSLRTGRVLARLVAFGGIAPLIPSTSLR